MATSLKNLSEHDSTSIPDTKGMSFGIVVSEWNHEITGSLLDGAVSTLKNNGVKSDKIYVERVPGSFELTLGAQLLAENTDADAIVCLGCIIQGDTPHFTYVCQGVTQGITELNITFNMPVIFGVLTVDTLQQAKDRAGGKHGNKGDEAAITAIKMVDLQRRLENS